MSESSTTEAWIEEELAAVAQMREEEGDDLLDQPSPPPPAEAQGGEEDAPAPPLPPPSPPRKRGRPRGKGLKEEDIENLYEKARVRSRDRTDDVVAKESPGLARVRDQMVLAAHLQGVSITNLAERFGLTPRQVKEAITDAQRSKAFKGVRDSLYFKLLPLALANIEEALKQGNLEASFKVSDAAKVTGTQAPAWGQTAGEGQVVDTFEAFRLRVIRGLPEGSTSADAVEGEVVTTPSFVNPPES